MQKGGKFVQLLVNEITKNLVGKDYIIVDDENYFKDKVLEIIINEYKIEKELEEEAEKILEENSDEIMYRGIPFFKARKLIKEKLAKERGIPASGSIFSREKANYLAGKILKFILTDDEIDYTQERGIIRQEIVKAFNTIAQLKKEVDQAAKHKIESMSKPIPEGTPEWFALYRKFYEEELISRGLLDTEETE
ncbi:DUF507 family protein [Desulfurobacterium indicum]|uniref:DUF507 domain-containing protein n=1 Tax=Desulfurobacterium indicum TaxID=1914305 RepID=A0A1R1MML8_9BACT|nr:DUF507 family protein [Desulfurobacterium indicum]OMH41016.1 hypothetical protein BLW93_02260 [Desulfurobacterium indicum]